MTRLRVRAAASLVAAMLSFALAAGEPHASLAAERANRFVYGDQIEPDSLNPYLSNTLAARRVEALVFSGLLRYGRGGAMLPDLAAVVPSRANGGVSADGLTITYHLRPGLRWHDGVPLTAADVVFTWRAVLDPANAVTTRVGFEEVARMDAPDARTVRMVFEHPYAPALTLFCVGTGAAAVLPRHALAGRDFDTAPFGGAPIGSGPYAFVRWDRGASIELRANPHSHLGVPHIGTIVYRIVPDTTTLFSQIRTHDLDGGEIEAAFVSRLRGDASVAIATAATLGYRHVEYNTTRPGLDDPNVRLALSYAIDREAIFRKIYFGIGSMSPGDVLPAAGWGDPRLRPYPYDPQRAARMLDRAGWKAGPDGIRTKGRDRLDFTLASIAGQHPSEATEVVLQADWQRLGIGVTIKNGPGVYLFSAQGPLVRGTFDIAYFGFVADGDPNDENRVGSSRWPPAGRNFARFADPLVDRLEARSLGTLDVAQRRTIVARLQEAIVARDPFDTIYWIPTILAHDRSVTGIDPVPAATIFWNVSDWRIVR